MDRLDTDAESEYLVPMTTNIVTSPDYFDYAELLGEFITDTRTLLRLTNSVVDKSNEVVAREVDDALDAAESPFRRIMDQQEEELQALYSELNTLRDNRNNTHEVLVNVARKDEAILKSLAGPSEFRRKIEAIKRLRMLTGAGLKATKEAVEDPRVIDAAAATTDAEEPLAQWEQELLSGNPWGLPSTD